MDNHFVASRANILHPAFQPKSDVPPLEPGDRLSRDEFERRYDATPNLNKAELIEGVVHMPPAVRWKHHGAPHARIMAWIGAYWAETPGVSTGDNSSIRLDMDNEPQPDAALIIDPECGGNAIISKDDYVEGAPELVVQVSSSTVSIDLGAKFKVYRRNGVREYIVWRVTDRAIDWFELRSGNYEPLTTADGILRSSVFPGLWLDVSLMLAGDLSGVLRVQRQGLASPQHADFVSQMKSRITPA